MVVLTSGALVRWFKMKTMLQYMGRFTINGRMLILQFIGCATLITAFTIAHYQVSTISEIRTQTENKLTQYKDAEILSASVSSFKHATMHYVASRDKAILPALSEYQKQIKLQSNGEISNLTDQLLETSDKLIQATQKNEVEAASPQEIKLVDAAPFERAIASMSPILKEQVTKNYRIWEKSNLEQIALEKAFFPKLVAFAFITIAFCAFLGFLITRSMISPLVRLTMTMTSLASGTKDIALPKYDSNDVR